LDAFCGNETLGRIIGITADQLICDSIDDEQCASVAPEAVCVKDAECLICISGQEWAGRRPPRDERQWEQDNCGPAVCQPHVFVSLFQLLFIINVMMKYCNSLNNGGGAAIASFMVLSASLRGVNLKFLFLNDFH
jgi:hypothetical protein